MLLLAESRAFFTVYRTITDTGMRIYQLDRESQQDTVHLSDKVGPHLFLLGQAPAAICAACLSVSRVADSCLHRATVSWPAKPAVGS